MKLSHKAGEAYHGQTLKLVRALIGDEEKILP
jgi:hypothetical protein